MRQAWLVLCSLLFATSAFGQGPLLWEVQEDSGGALSTGRGITLSKGKVVVTGNATQTDGSVDFFVQALGRSDGTVKWTDQVPSDRNQLLPVFVTSVQGTVYAAGYAPHPPLETDIVVRAYDVRTGTLLWNSIWEKAGPPHALAATSEAVVVIGQVGTPVAENFIVRAYDRSTGSVIWEDQVSRDNNSTAAFAVATTETRVFVAGEVLTTTGLDLMLRAYDISSGELKWETDRPATSPFAVLSFSGQVLVVGSTSSGHPSSDHPYIAAFDETGGTLLWDDEAPVSGSLRSVAAHGDRIVAVGGVVVPGVGRELLVQAYDAETGIFMWQDQPPVIPSFPSVSEGGSKVAVSDTGVYVCGVSEQDFVYSEMLVRAYTPLDGTLLWDDRSHRAGSSFDSSRAVDLAVDRHRLFVVGDTNENPGDTDVVIRAYDTRPAAAQTTLENASMNGGSPFIVNPRP